MKKGKAKPKCKHKHAEAYCNPVCTDCGEELGWGVRILEEADRDG